MTDIYIARCALRAAKNFVGEIGGPRSCDGWVRIMRDGVDEDSIRVDASDGNILFTCNKAGRVDKEFPENGILLEAADIQRHLKVRKNSHYDLFSLGSDGFIHLDGDDKVIISTKSAEFFPDVNMVIDPTLKDAIETLEYVDYIRNAEPERRIAEIGWGLDLVIALTNGVKEFVSYKKGDFQPLRIRLTQRTHPAIIEFENSIGLRARVFFMSLNPEYMQKTRWQEENTEEENKKDEGE